MLVLVDRRGRKHLVEEDREEYHTTYGVVDLREAGPGKVLESHLGHKFYCLRANMIDYYERLPRAGSIILKKDLGSMAANCGIGSGSRVVDAGTGSGGAAIFFAHLVGGEGRVYTYEIKEEHLNIARKNFARAGVEGIVESRLEDVREGIGEREVDAVVFDLPDPWMAIDKAFQALKVGGCLAVYNPYVEQINRACQAMKGEGFMEVKAIELLERKLDVKKVGTRHSTRSQGHTAYLAYGRKYTPQPNQNL